VKVTAPDSSKRSRKKTAGVTVVEHSRR
jgi:hypothetical protein